MTELLFQTDSYLKEFEAEVRRVDQECQLHGEVLRGLQRSDAQTVPALAA